MVPYIKPPGVQNLIVSLVQKKKRAKKRPAVRRGCFVGPPGRCRLNWEAL